MEMRKISKGAGVLLIAAVMSLTSFAVSADTVENELSMNPSCKCTPSVPYEPLNFQDTILYFYNPGTMPSTCIGITGGTPPYKWRAGIRLTPDELHDWECCNITAVNVYHCDYGFEHTGDIEIYGPGTNVTPGALITKEPYSFLGEGWQHVILKEPVHIDGVSDIWVVVYLVSWDQDWPMGCDAGPAVDGKGDWANLGGGWAELQSYGLEFDINWGIEAEVVCGPIEYPPTAPIIDGPSKGPAGEELCWTFHSDDFNGDMVKYHIDWDDGNSEVTDLNEPCVPVEVCHIYEDQDTYTITAYAEDETGLTGDSSSFRVEIPRARTVYHPLLLRLFERFPNLFPILRQLLVL